MKFTKFILGPICIILSVSSNGLKARVDPPNYNFSLDMLEDFNPGKQITEIQKKYKSGALQEEKNDLKVYKFYISYLRYKFPVFVQAQSGKVTDYFAKLPSYFLHDTFHQSLINRFKKQDKYVKKENHANYIWNNRNNINYIYQGSCTITCFPVYLSGISSKLNAGTIPLIEKFNVAKKGPL